jgi:hypothetical protein
VIARLALAGVAIAVAVAFAVSKGHHDACEQARTTIFEVTLGHEPAARQPEAIAQVRDECRGTTALVAAAGALHRQGRDPAALALAREAARREPGSAQAWSAVAATAPQAEARAAEARLRALDPLAHPSLNRSAGRSIR